MDNTEGSQAIKQTYRVRKNSVLHLSKQQIEIVLGCILGDAYIYPQGKICIEHGIKQQEYLLWKYQQLESLAYPKISQVVRWDKRINKNTISKRFFLRQYFRPLRKIFYLNRKKVIPSQLVNWISPLLLAIWYMDDGHLDKNKYPSLMTECYTKNDNLKLKNWLYQKFNIDTIINKKNRILIKSNSTDKFFQLIKPFIHKSLLYKLP